MPKKIRVYMADLGPNGLLEIPDGLEFAGTTIDIVMDQIGMHVISRAVLIEHITPETDETIDHKLPAASSDISEPSEPAAPEVETSPAEPAGPEPAKVDEKKEGGEDEGEEDEGEKEKVKETPGEEEGKEDEGKTSEKEKEQEQEKEDKKGDQT